MAVNPEEAQYFIDESGQDHLFDSAGNPAVGINNNSRFFLVGFLYSDDPEGLANKIRELRFRLRKDPYLQFTESMQREDPRRRTYYKFHAVDDCFEARHAMFKLLHDFPNLRFLACVLDKETLLGRIEKLKGFGGTVEYTRNDLYDMALERLFRDQLAKSSKYKIIIARRGKPRTSQLTDRLYAAQERYKERWGKDTNSEIEVIPMYSKDHPNLQAADYFLWGLHRLYEHKDFRYVKYLWHLFRLVIDAHDHRRGPIGRYYNARDPVTPESLAGWVKN